MFVVRKKITAKQTVNHKSNEQKTYFVLRFLGRGAGNPS